MEISETYLISNGFEREDYCGKVFYHKDKYMITYDTIYGWMPCDNATHCVSGHIETVEQLQRLMAEAK